MLYKFQKLTVISVFLALVTSCESTAEKASAGDATKSEPSLTVTTSVVYTSAPPTATPRQPSATATVVVPTFTLSPDKIVSSVLVFITAFILNASALNELFEFTSKLE